MLRGSPTQARSVIQRVIDGRSTFSPFRRREGSGYDFAGRTRFDRLFSGCYLQVPAWVVAHDAALNEVFDPTDTRDADYGKLLENFYN